MYVFLPVFESYMRTCITLLQLFLNLQNKTHNFGEKIKELTEFSEHKEMQLNDSRKIK